MTLLRSAWIGLLIIKLGSTAFGQPRIVQPSEKRLNNLTSDLLEVTDIGPSDKSFNFHRDRAGWIFLSASVRGSGKLSLKLDGSAIPLATAELSGTASRQIEAMRSLAAGAHQLHIDSDADIRVDRLVVRSIPELMHCGLGYDPAIRSYGKYDLEFLKKDILPNVTTLIVPHHIKLDQLVIDDWHDQGKKFVASVGVDGQAKTADEHYQHWAGYLERAPFVDGLIIDEFIINLPLKDWGVEITAERLKRRDDQRALHPIYEEAFRKMRADERFKDKMIYAYFGGSGKKLVQEVIGPNFVRNLLNCNYRIALERYLFEVSSEQKSKDVLQHFVEGITDWVEKEPTVREQMVLTFGLFSMPPGGINKQPNVDYHVWMDQQMNVVANHPIMKGMGGLNWWTSLQADEETVRFVGKLYHHYAIEGKTDLYTKDPLFLNHVQNADFQKGVQGWNLHPAEAASIQAKSFPRYGRIEGRYMGLGRPADPEHIGDTFLWMKRSNKGPNSFSQEIRNLEPGGWYSLKMFSCDYQDLINPTKKTKEEAIPFMGKVCIDNVEIDDNRTFAEMYSSSPEPPIPVWITYHWIVFRAKGKSASLTVSDWSPDSKLNESFGQEQTFNFLELEPYHE